MSGPHHRQPSQPSPFYSGDSDVGRRSLGGLSSFCSFNLAYPVENESVGCPTHTFPKNYDNSLYNDQEVQAPVRLLTGSSKDRRTYHQVRFSASGDLFKPEEIAEEDEKEVTNCPPHGKSPAWNRNRPYLTGHHQWIDEDQAMKQPERVKEHSTSMQEVIILEDLLYGFMGLGGQYLQFQVEESLMKKKDIRCVLGVELDTSLQQKVLKVLSVCEDVVIMQRFIETRLPFESGVVSHAVASAMRNVLDDWMLMVTQLEALFRRGKLTMQSLWYYIQAPLGTLQIVAGIARKAAAESLGGPGLLQLIHRTLEDYTGNRNAQVLLQRLLATACAPYFEMLEKWLCEGIVDDPYEEFMISEKQGVLQKSMTENLESKYWHERYTIRGGDEDEIGVPMFLDQYQVMILKTGKYLNAIRECGLTVHRPLDRDERVMYDSGRSYVALIHKAHKESSHAFLQLFMQDLRLLSWLRGLKHFFLHDRGDMISHLMDIADEEFSKTPDQVSHTRLQSLMELAVRTSSVPSHTNSEPLAFEFDPLSLVEMAKGIFDRRKMHSCFRSSMQSSVRGSTRIPRVDEELNRTNKRTGELITGFDVFMVTYRVDWPMTLIVPEKQMLRYKLLFKHLFLLKRSERALASAWHILQFSRRLSDRRAAATMQRTCLLCHKFMHTIQMYFRFITVEILEPEWNSLEAEISRAEDVDKVIEVHRLFVSRVLRHSLLRKLKVITQLEGIEHDALKFSSLIKRSIRVDEVLETPARVVHARKQRQNWHRELQNHAIAEDFSSKDFLSSLAKLESGYQEKLDSLLFHMKAAYDACSGTNQEVDPDGPKETREDLDCLMNLIERLASRGS